jgi:hypothetical protein
LPETPDGFRGSTPTDGDQDGAWVAELTDRLDLSAAAAGLEVVEL